jgi:hypothetical protein
MRVTATLFTPPNSWHRIRPSASQGSLGLSKTKETLSGVSVARMVRQSSLLAHLRIFVMLPSRSATNYTEPAANTKPISSFASFCQQIKEESAPLGAARHTRTNLFMLMPRLMLRSHRYGSKPSARSKSDTSETCDVSMACSETPALRHPVKIEVSAYTIPQRTETHHNIVHVARRSPAAVPVRVSDELLDSIKDLLQQAGLLEARFKHGKGVGLKAINT